MSKTSNKAAIKRIVKNSKKVSARTSLHGYWVDNDGYEVVSDGFHIIRYNGAVISDIDEIDKVDGVQQLSKKCDDIAKICENGHTLTLPTIKELKEFIKIVKNQPYDFGENKPLVDAKYLLDMIEGIDNCEAKFIGVNQPIYFFGDNAHGVLCPIYKEGVENNV